MKEIIFLTLAIALILATGCSSMSEYKRGCLDALYVDEVAANPEIDENISRTYIKNAHILCDHRESHRTRYVHERIIRERPLK